jgi:hypothetical protein
MPGTEGDGTRIKQGISAMIIDCVNHGVNQEGKMMEMR